MSFRVIRQGLYDTIQDAGRPLCARKGIPVSGVMDEYLSGMANLLVGKAENAALVEIFKLGPKLKFDQDLLVAITALDADVYLDSTAVSLNEAFEVKAGQELDIQKINKGNFAYLTFSGDIQTASIAGSRSFHPSLTPNSRLPKNVTFPVKSGFHLSDSENFAQVKVNTEYYDDETIHVFAGAELDQLTQKHQQELLNRSWKLADNLTRMAFQVESSIDHQISDILTAPVFPGTVQLNHAGELTILMKDAQTTGGYPRALQVVEEDLKKLAQKQSGAYIRFQPVRMY